MSSHGVARTRDVCYLFGRVTRITNKLALDQPKRTPRSGSASEDLQESHTGAFNVFCFRSDEQKIDLTRLHAIRQFSPEHGF